SSAPALSTRPTVSRQDQLIGWPSLRRRGGSGFATSSGSNSRASRLSWPPTMLPRCTSCLSVAISRATVSPISRTVSLRVSCICSPTAVQTSSRALHAVLGLDPLAIQRMLEVGAHRGVLGAQLLDLAGSRSDVGSEAPSVELPMRSDLDKRHELTRTSGVAQLLQRLGLD